jgi:hypothetical protein
MNEQAIFSEAPASVTIKTISPAGFDVMLTIRDADTAALMGRIKAALGWLADNGYRPTAHMNGSKPNASANNDAPICPYHGPMKRSKKFNGWYCSAKMGDGSYCKEKVTD